MHDFQRFRTSFLHIHASNFSDLCRLLLRSCPLSFLRLIRHDLYTVTVYKSVSERRFSYNLSFPAGEIARNLMHVYPRRAHERPAGAQPAVFT